MSVSHSPLEGMIRKLGTRAPLDDADRAAILALPYVVQKFHACTYVIREGARPRTHCAFIHSGFAFRQKITAEGNRQIVSLHMAGDFIDLQHLFLTIADHNVQALTPLETIGIDRTDLQQLTRERPAIAVAMWIDALVDASIYREWVMNVGRRDARARVAHTLCEFALRVGVAGLPTDNGFEMPMTQEQLGDAVGLTSVHVNRTLKALEAEGIVQRSKRFVKFSDWNAMRAVGDFNPLYLHLDQAPPDF
jgi:CRP-like cAMP-binding protein